jgi:hypothetical protein
MVLINPLEVLACLSGMRSSIFAGLFNKNRSYGRLPRLNRSLFLRLFSIRLMKQLNKSCKNRTDIIEEQWQEFCAALDAQPGRIPALYELMNTPGVFEKETE